MRFGDGRAAEAVVGGRPTRAEIDLAALGRNLRALAQRARRPAMAVVKADAYGHGAVQVARAAREAGAPWLGVATAGEGLELRRAGDAEPILVLGGLYPEEVDEAVAADLTPVLHALPGEGAAAETDPAAAVVGRLASLGRQRGRPVAVHLKVDTGMHRLGLLPAELPACLDRLERHGGALRLDGLMSHLAAADDPAETAFTRAQRRALDEALALLERRGHAPTHLHVDNSAGLAEPWPRATMVRAGIALYGAHAPAGVAVEPVMSLVSAVTGLKDVAAGDTVSYGRAFRATRPSRVAIVPAGYADGLPRQLSSVGWALVRGLRAPIAGRVCMDWTMLDVTDIPATCVGDPVLWFGRLAGAALPAEEVAALTGTVAYTLFCGVGPRVPRRYTGAAP